MELSVVSASCPTAVARPLHKGRGGGGATGRRPYNPPSPFQGQNHKKLPSRAPNNTARPRRGETSASRAPNNTARPRRGETSASRAPNNTARPRRGETSASRAPNNTARPRRGETSASRAPNNAARPEGGEARASRVPSNAACPERGETRASLAPNNTARPGRGETRANRAPKGAARPERERDARPQWRRNPRLAHSAPSGPPQKKCAGGYFSSAFEDSLLKEGGGELNKPGPALDRVILGSTTVRHGKPAPTPFAHPGCKTHGPQTARANLLYSSGSQSFEP